MACHWILTGLGNISAWVLMEPFLEECCPCPRVRVCGWVCVFVWSVPPGQGQWHCICTTGLSSRNVIMSRLGSRWWGRWSLTISSLNGSQGAHSRQGLVYTTLLLSAAVKLEKKGTASWKMQISQVCADDSPLDGARDLFCIFSLTSGGTVASAGVELRKSSRSSRLIETQLTLAFQCIVLYMSINIYTCCNNLRMSCKKISSQSPASSVLFLAKY